MNRRSFLHRLTATAGAVCLGFALELQAPEPTPAEAIADAFEVPREWVVPDELALAS